MLTFKAQVDQELEDHPYGFCCFNHLLFVALA